MATEGRNIAIYGETPDGLEDDGSLEQERLLAVPMVVAAVMARMVVAAVRTCPRRSRHPSQGLAAQERWHCTGSSQRNVIHPVKIDFCVRKTSVCGYHIQLH
ncbi:uncharacterized protein [Aegilops tauschii subsp. strangulata]|uniref:uncharacterized protein isoform X2 n=1 Tax=Aegilops tauschii subsp. strangulata TaxID=200361 RepID=UPI003CC8B50D